MKEETLRYLEERKEAIELVGKIIADIRERAAELRDEDMVTLLDSEKWFPMVKVTDVELRASEILNGFLDTLIKKLKAQ